jgi:hypothetical protein
MTTSSEEALLNLVYPPRVSVVRGPFHSVDLGKELTAIR